MPEAQVESDRTNKVGKFAPAGVKRKLAAGSSSSSPRGGKRPYTAMPFSGEEYPRVLFKLQYPPFVQPSLTLRASLCGG